MSTSQCFAIPELMRSIAEWVHTNGDLFVLATVSRSFSTHALDFLWGDISDLEPFLSTLPRGLVVKGENESLVRFELPTPFPILI